MKTAITIILGIASIWIIYSFTNPKADFKKDTTGGIEFKRDSWNQSIARANKENKLIFLDVYATWCGPCKKLKSNTFSNTEVGSFFNANFVNVALDAEAGEGIQIAEKYKVEEYPTLLFIDGDGTVKYKISGYQNPSQLITLAKKLTN